MDATSEDALDSMGRVLDGCTILEFESNRLAVTEGLTGAGDVDIVRAADGTLPLSTNKLSEVDDDLALK